MSETNTAVVEQPTAPTPVGTPVPEPRVEPPHVMPGEQAPSTDHPIDDGGPLDDVVDEDTHQPRQRGSRAKSKMAAARINALTKDRNELRQRLEALEKAQKATSAPPVPRSAYQPVTMPAVEFAEAEPTLEQFADKDDPYGAWQRALAAYDRRKEAAEQQSQHLQATQRQAQQEQQRYWDGVRVTHQQRLVAAVQAKPELFQAIQQADQSVSLPPVLDRAVMLDERGVDMAVFLATHPDELDELVSRAAALPPTEQSVALMRRLVRKEMTAGTTGSVAPPNPIPNAPRPPNPVRTGAIRTGAEPPGSISSIAEHAKHFGPKR